MGLEGTYGPRQAGQSTAILRSATAGLASFFVGALNLRLMGHMVLLGNPPSRRQQIVLVLPSPFFPGILLFKKLPETQGNGSGF